MLLQRPAVFLLLVGACRGEPQAPRPHPGWTPGAGIARVAYAPQTACATPVPVFADGKQNGTVCPEEAGKWGLTVVDLSDDWVPAVFRDPQPYHDKYIALANER